MWVVVERDEEALEKGMKTCREQRRQNARTQQPDDDGVPLPCPQQMRRRPLAMADGMQKDVARERQRSGVEQHFAGAQVDERQRQLQREEQVVGDLRCDQVESEDDGDSETDQRGRADDRVDPDGSAHGQRPGEFARRSSDAQQMQQRADDVRLEESSDGMAMRNRNWIRDGRRCDWGGHSVRINWDKLAGREKTGIVRGTAEDFVAVIRSVARSIKAVVFFGWYGLELVVKRPKTRCERAQWLNRFCQALQRAFNVTFTVEGSFPARGVLISNHTGYLDIMAYAALKPVVYCAKAEMESWPFLGWMTTMAGTVFVDRGAGGSAEKARGGMKAAEDAGIPVVFFPEGTTSNGQEILPFKTGLLAISLEAQQPITAAYIRYTLDVDNGPGVTVEDDVCFWGEDAPMFRHIFKMVGLRGVHGWVKIASEPIRFSHSDIDRKQAAVEARDAILALAGLQSVAVEAPVGEEAMLHQK